MDFLNTSLNLLKSSPIHPLVERACVVFAALVLLKFFLGLLRSFYVHFLRSGKNIRKYGQWAIVTGCTDGIGKAIAEEFAAKKLNLVLISRSQQKLDEQAKEIASKFGVETKTVAVDFSLENPSIFDPVRTAIKNLDVGILVNNVGMSYDHAEFFLELEQGRAEKIIRINVFGTVQMTQIVLPGMVERKRGAIVNISSASGFVNEPLYAVYSATKAFVNTFSIALHYEYKGKGVSIQAQVPAFVTSKLSKLRNTSFLICSPRAYARALCKHIGYDPIITSYWTHALQLSLAAWVPTSTLCSTLLSRGLGIRKRALMKKSEKQH